MMQAQTQASPANVLAREAFYASLKGTHLAPLWTQLHSLVTPEPKTPMVPALWRYSDVRPYLMQAGELISAQEAVRRVLILENPAAPGAASITRTLYAGLQLIMPGEVAPCHRHTQSAFRFIMEGDGAYTAVRGERAPMHKYDLILTPNWDWHDHGNPSSGPMIWLDGLDIPLHVSLDTSFTENLDAEMQASSSPPSANLHRWGRGLRPVRQSPRGPDQAISVPRFQYPFAEWRETLRALSRSEPIDDYEGVRAEFLNPVDGGPIMPTMSAFVQWLPASFTSKALQQTDGTVFTVVEGRGAVTIGGQRFDLQEQDVFVTPAWMPVVWDTRSEMVLFSFSDRSLQQKLGLWRERRG